MTHPVLQERAQSGFPLSIGTSLALETILKPAQAVFDENRPIPPRPDPIVYSDHLVNVSTLARNLITSVKFQDLKQCSTKQVTEVFLEEIDYLKTLFQMQDLSLHLYHHTYAFVHQTYKDKLRTISTPQQHHLFNLLEACIKAVKPDKTLITFSKDIHLPEKTNTLVITHIPWDLLSYARFKRLDLLESHTGVIKTRKDYNTKYFRLGDKDMSFLPFMEYLLMTFGDTSMVKPAPIKEREQLYDNLLKKKVHPLMGEISLLLN